ncbi:TBC-domain-containing protein [Sporormia fimetaria CBS 119925]|uniref:TBC-domain-containing protein n=1 Tax=Sporormia fimetaria CBS 119925 TaxID=1340428 RepID=A0A6A6V7J7_9PLEO|nr:TBC-domain-containing protein [Sporormia fimetaria CBS 119925]
MTAVESPVAVGDLSRTISHVSTTSSSRKSSTTRVRPSKRSSTTSLGRAPSPAATDDKSLTSFPSLAPTPDASPVQSRINGWFCGTAAGDATDKNEQDKTAVSQDNPAPMGLPDPPTKAVPQKGVRKVTKSTQELVGSLVSTTPSRHRSSLFDDTPPELRKVPGSLHCLSDADIERMIESTGAVALIKQLAGDLAQRDAQVTAVRRRAEERERILRKMLQECEVSNMDVETRLRQLDNSGGPAGALKRPGRRADEHGLPGMHPEDSLEQRLARAMEDEVFALPEPGSDGITNVRGVGEGPFDSTSAADHGTGRGNWRSYIWSGTGKKSSRAPSVASTIDREAGSASMHTRSRASSRSRQGSRKPLNNETFVPPPSTHRESGAIPTLRRLQSQDQIKSSASSRRSTTSIASWALKMVAGNHQAKGNTDRPNTLRGRETMASHSANRTPSMGSTRSNHSTKSGTTIAQRRGARTSLGPNGTIKSISGDVSKPTVVNQPTRGMSNLGPVEMERILPEESRPPTLVQHHNHFAASHEYLTDRFGFIYDQRRKKRQSEAAAALAKHDRGASNVESIGNDRPGLNSGNSGDTDSVIGPFSDASVSQSPSRPESRSSDEQGSAPSKKTWQDYLKLATHPTELLSHTPSTAPMIETAEPDIGAAKGSQVTVVKRGSLPSTSVNPEPSPSRIVSGNAEFITVSPLGPASPISPIPPPADPVKVLLEQLTDLHDSLQRDKTVKWNEFLRKVRAERKREGEAVTSDASKALTMPEALLADGEIIGVAGLGNKGKVGRAKWQEFRRLVLGGIPVAYRAKIWAECSGASALRIPGYYDELVKSGTDNPTIVTQIQMDITRTLTDNIFFRKGPGVRKLNEVLIAYSRRNPEVGYCQGMNLITACLLLIMPTAEDAFWVLATMIENILPEKYYDQHLLTSRADQSVLREYVAELLPKLSKHLDILEIELEALTFQWFLSVFTDCLSAEALYRVWDVLLCMHDGSSTFLFQVALALLKLNERSLLNCGSPSEVYHYINHQMTNHAISIDSLIQASEALGKVVRRKDVEERRERAVEREVEVMREREEARKLRSRKSGGLMVAEGGSGEAVMPGSVKSGKSVRSADEEEVGEALGGRTPLPVEEESMWRG